MVKKMKNKTIDRMINEPMPWFYVMIFTVFIIAVCVIFMGLPIMFGALSDLYFTEHGVELPTNQRCMSLFQAAGGLVGLMILYIVTAVAVELFSLRREAFDASDVMCGIEWYLNSRKGEYCAFLETDPPGDKSKLTLNSIAEIDSMLSELERMQKIMEEG
jgi:uncharacterized membrane protein YedE/YeeE